MHAPFDRCPRHLAWRRAPLLALLCVAAPALAQSPPPTNPTAPLAVDAGSTPPAATLLNAADDIARQVVALRGLRVRHPIQRGVLSRDEIGRHLQARLDREYTPDEVRVEAMMLKRLGLLPEEADYRALLVSLLMEQVAGFYDPDAKKLYIADWLGLAMQRPTLAHELEHALQDQHFDLQRFAAPIKDNGDEQLARSALAEGDGMAVMMEFVSRSMGLDLTQVPRLVDSVGRQLAAGSLDQSPEFSKAPRFLRETLLFPYFAGMQFVFALRQSAPSQAKAPTRAHAMGNSGERGWARVDAAFRKPPASTEQVLHPEKYLAGEAPVRITAAPLHALAPRVELRHDVLGELSLRVLLDSRLDESVAERAAAGWGGDRLVVYGPPREQAQAGDATSGSAVVVVDRSAWDTEADARQAEAALRELVARQTGYAPSAKGSVYVKGGEAWSVERRGAEVLAIFGAPEAQRAAAAAEAWTAWTVEPARPTTPGTNAMHERSGPRHSSKRPRSPRPAR